MSTYGDCVVSRVNCGMVDEHVRVDQADPVILVAAELIEDWLAGRHLDYVRLEEGGIFIFGTAGEGHGRVAYQLGERHDQHTYVARLLDEPDRAW